MSAPDPQISRGLFPDMTPTNLRRCQFHAREGCVNPFNRIYAYLGCFAESTPIDLQRLLILRALGSSNSAGGKLTKILEKILGGECGFWEKNCRFWPFSAKFRRFSRRQIGRVMETHESFWGGGGSLGTLPIRNRTRIEPLAEVGQLHFNISQGFPEPSL
jgi:hypothetical protein